MITLRSDPFVAAQLPSVAVPEIGNDAATYPRILDRNQYFEAFSLSAEDLSRSAQYAGNAKRNELQAKFSDYSEFLASLGYVKAEAGPFIPTYLERIAQLTGKTNQFNLTTKPCYSLAEIESIACSPSLCDPLLSDSRDRFGDKCGVISVAIGQAGTRRLFMWTSG